MESTVVNNRCDHFNNQCWRYWSSIYYWLQILENLTHKLCYNHITATDANPVTYSLGRIEIDEALFNNTAGVVTFVTAPPDLISKDAPCIEVKANDGFKQSTPNSVINHNTDVDDIQRYLPLTTAATSQKTEQAQPPQPSQQQIRNAHWLTV
jgi:hypothetical protein